MAHGPFGGTLRPSRVRIFRKRQGPLPIPTPWNYRRPLGILASIWEGAEEETGFGRHNRYLHGFGLTGLVTRDPEAIRAILLATGDKPGQFDRDPWPARGIARFTGEDTMLYANGPAWRNQKRLAAPSFSRSSLFRPERFGAFEATFRHTIKERIEALVHVQAQTGEDETTLPVEPEVSVVMLEMLVNNFFGASVPYENLRERHVPAINDLIRHMVRDTVMPGLAGPRTRRAVRAWRRSFEALTDEALGGRPDGLGAWAQFRSDAPDAALRSNIRVFLAGALEATTSLATWALVHLARRPDLQERIFDEIQDMDVYDPDNLAKAVTLGRVIDETLRLTPSLYFLPRRATVDTTLGLSTGTLTIPKGTRVILDVWHANRNEEVWGETATGHPATTFAPERWEALDLQGKGPREALHFGFGHGPRVCPGRFLGLLEVGLLLGGFIKAFRFHADGPVPEARAGVSTKPADGALLTLARRSPRSGPPTGGLCTGRSREDFTGTPS